MSHGSEPSDTLDDALRAVRAFVDQHREQCLWYIRRDWSPHTIDDALRALDAIERHGDVTAFRDSASLRAWLSRTSNVGSAAR